MNSLNIVKIHFKLNYSSNFKLIGALNQHWIFCKKFIGFLFLINFFKGKNDLENTVRTFTFANPLFFFKKNKQKLFVINRAPYRYKRARNQLTISRYFFLFTFELKLSLAMLHFNTNFDVIQFVNKFWFLFNSLESNIAFLNSYKMVFFFKKPLQQLSNYN